MSSSLSSSTSSKHIEPSSAESSSNTTEVPQYSDSGSDTVIFQVGNNTYVASVHFSSKSEVCDQQVNNIFKIYHHQAAQLSNSSDPLVMIVQGDFNTQIYAPNMQATFNSHRSSSCHILEFEPEFYTSFKTRNITNQFDKVNKPVQNKIDNAFIISNQPLIGGNQIQIQTCGLDGVLKENMPYPTEYPSDHYGTLLTIPNLNYNIFSLNILGESIGKDFFNLFEFYPAELLVHFDKFVEARQLVNESQEFSAFYNDGLAVLKDKAMAYNKRLREFGIFDVHEPIDELKNDEFFHNLMQKRAILYQEFCQKTETEPELRVLGDKMLAYQHALINHPHTLPYVRQWLEFLKTHPKLPYTTILRNIRDKHEVHVICLQEVNDQLLDLLFEDSNQDLVSSYDVYGMIGNEPEVITKDTLDQFKERNQAYRMSKKFKTYGLMLVLKSNLKQSELSGSDEEKK